MYKVKNKVTNKGFTMIELLVVVVIISILSMAVVAGVTAYMNKGKAEYNKSLSGQVALSAKSFYPENSERIPVGTYEYDYVTLKELASLNYIKGEVVDSEERNCMNDSYVVVQKTEKDLKYTVCLLCGEGENKVSYIEDKEICDVKYELEEEKEPEVKPITCKISKVSNTSISLTIEPDSEISRISKVKYYHNNVATTLDGVNTTYDNLAPGTYKFVVIEENGAEYTCNNEVNLEEPPKVEVEKLQCVSVNSTKTNSATKLNVKINVSNEDLVSNVIVNNGTTKTDLGKKFETTLGYGNYTFTIKGKDSDGTSKEVTCSDKASLTLPGLTAEKYYATKSQYDSYKSAGKLTSTQLGKLVKYDGSWKNGYVYVVVTNPEHFDSLKYKIDDTTTSITNNHFWITKEGNKTTTISGVGKGTTTTKTASVTTKLNRTGPVIKIDNPSDGNWINTDLTLTVTVTDSTPGISKIEYSYDKESWTERTSFATNTNTKKIFKPTYTATQDKILYVKATDKAGNTSAIVSTNIKIDKVAPTITVANSSGSNWVNENIDITIKATDSNSKIKNIKYKYDSGSWNTKTSYDSSSTTNTKVWTPEYTKEQNKVLYVYATDKAGNTSTTKSTKIKIDKTDPEITFSVNKSIQDGGWYKASDTSPVKITVKCNAAISGKKTFKVNSDTKSGTSYTVTLKKANRPYTVKAECTDNAGNKSTKTKDYYTRTYQECGCSVYKTCEASACGAASCRNKTCSCAKYGTKYEYDWVKTHTGLKTEKTRGASFISSAIGLSHKNNLTCNSSNYLKDAYSSATCISCVRGGASAAPDCTPASNNHCNQYSYNKWECRRSTVTDKSNCITRNSCASATYCGYKSCATSACGCKTKKYCWQY